VSLPGAPRLRARLGKKTVTKNVNYFPEKVMAAAGVGWYLFPIINFSRRVIARAAAPLHKIVRSCSPNENARTGGGERPEFGDTNRTTSMINQWPMPVCFHFTGPEKRTVRPNVHVLRWIVYSGKPGFVRGS
jgi:hypothetical protein